MKKALVLGASGGMGYALVRELIQRDFSVTVFARSKEKLNKLFSRYSEVTIVHGDAFNQKLLAQISENQDIIFHAINLPYGDWQDKLLPLTENILQATKKNNAKLAIVDNIYAYGKHMEAIKETAIKHPHTKKGKLRLQVEKQIMKSNVPYVLAHFPDFFGPYAENTQLNFTLQSVAANKRAWFIGSHHIEREHLFTFDGAKALVNLSLQDKSYGEHWNIPAARPIEGVELIKLIRDLTGYEKNVGTVTTNMLRLLGIFNQHMREFVEMQYLNQHPVILIGEKYEERIGALPRTPYKKALELTLNAYQNGTT
ncbi:SDR family NAD(P)-dependent oxidoreductase [Virgibacillus chiguensis]|uniref:Nucleoside-diphosphate-sugar epimerase n=1 Tax=Virgibacillus chiguensis TaxID=411959 RepID=A0A1M5QDU1_9BACI|nr:SDR family NAD(P)-dependent oxidoreductase [Virgibacillus chiguensis]SHH12006.1 Nucleoside-diphosphate-sugar epimerase [Virgibacillus chiguensis]